MDMTHGELEVLWVYISRLLHGDAVGIDLAGLFVEMLWVQISRHLHGDAVGIDLAGFFMEMMAATGEIDG